MNRPPEAVGTSEAVSDCKRERLLLQQALPFFSLRSCLWGNGFRPASPQRHGLWPNRPPARASL